MGGDKVERQPERKGGVHGGEGRQPQKGPKTPIERVNSSTQVRGSWPVQAQERKACTLHPWPRSQWQHWGDCSLGRVLYSRPWGPAAAAVLQHLLWLSLFSRVSSLDYCSIVTKRGTITVDVARAEKGLWCPGLSQSHWTHRAKDRPWEKRQIQLQIYRIDSLPAQASCDSVSPPTEGLEWWWQSQNERRCSATRPFLLPWIERPDWEEDSDQQPGLKHLPHWSGSTYLFPSWDSAASSCPAY